MCRPGTTALLLALVPAFGLVVADSPRAGGPDRVQVTNLPDPPPPRTLLLERSATVTRAGAEETKLYTDAGVLEATGYARAVLSLAGRVKGYPEREATVGVILVPEVAAIQKVLKEEDRLRFPISVEATVPGARYDLFEAEQREARLAFPRYRVFFYNTGPRPVELTLYAYLSAD